MRWLLGGCGTCAVLLGGLLAVMVIIAAAVVIVISQVYLAAIYTWFFSEDTVDVPTSIHGMPTTGFITATYHDPDYFDMFGEEHTGVDIANGRGTPIYNTSDEAKVVGGGLDSSGYGLYIKLQDIESGYYILYAHLDSISSEILSAYATGTIGSLRLQHGDRVGEMGSTGNSTGNHLHYEIRDSSNTAVDPDGSAGCCN